MIGQTSLASLPTLRDYTSHRTSSYDTTGGNADFWRIEAGENRTLCEIDGPGCIKHLWMTLGIPQEDYCRRIIIRGAPFFVQKTCFPRLKDTAHSLEGTFPNPSLIPR